MRAGAMVVSCLAALIAGGPAPGAGVPLDPATILTQTSRAAPGLVGTWRLVKDDDTPGKKPPPETITFRTGGTYRVEGSGEPFDGRYRVDGEEIVMSVVVDGNTRVMRRRFRLDAEGLHFANPNQGFAHYSPVR